MTSVSEWAGEPLTPPRRVATSRPWRSKKLAYPIWIVALSIRQNGVSTLISQDPAFRARIQASFDKQELMSILGASILHMAPDAVDIALLPKPSVSQQHGFVHASAVAPAAGERAVAWGRVIKARRTLTLTQTEVFSETAGEKRLAAALTAILMTIEGPDGEAD
jgi:acyl-coenzyme A thioesterase PaaI-like protein